MLNRYNTFHKGCATGSVRVTCQESNKRDTRLLYRYGEDPLML